MAQEFLRQLPSMLETGLYSDVKLVCRNEVYELHKNILAAQSPFFAAKFRFGNAENGNLIDLGEEDPKLVNWLIKYLYNFDYDGGCDHDHCQSPRTKPAWGGEASSPEPGQDVEGEEGTAGPANESDDASDSGWTCHPTTAEIQQDGWSCELSNCLEFNCGMYALAEKYDIPGLKSMALNKFGSAIGKCDLFGGVFRDVLLLVYSSTPSTDHGLRDIIVSALSMAIRSDASLVKDPAMVEILEGYEGLAVEVLQRLVKPEW